ncbi:MAG: GNAT family N-acetyltransferase [Desulfitobacteriaceae bacterium]|nr:GNAT family N-acetyltransferase [Desulfitobacteriaceae bacterium]MDI6879172.1 GNAT family N-acetyltransferase [Desulfitobacteriaceae bacterium]MDI6914941.1 GNAT family N-acetyltransferase [Desulfitobacteriaceae bacterium]
MQIRFGDVQDWPFLYALGKTVIMDSVSPWRQQSESKTMKYRTSVLNGFWTWIQQNNAIIFVAESEEKENPVKAGYLVLYPESREELTGMIQGWVMDVAVLPEFRGQGMGRALLVAAEDYCRDTGIEYLGLAVSSHNVKALALYEQLGYAEERKLMVKVVRPN